MSAKVTRHGILDMQVCIPTDWTDEQALTFAEKENPVGTEASWQIRKEGSQFLKGAPERVTCEDRTGYIHIMLDA